MENMNTVARSVVKIIRGTDLPPLPGDHDGLEPFDLAMRHAVLHLHKQVEDAKAEVKRLEKWVDDTQSGMWINCVYCGHRYGPDDGDHLRSMRDALREHVEQCPKHPMSRYKAIVDKLPRTADGVPVVPGSRSGSTQEER